MGIWAEIKRTINSTLGTASFQPLDEIIEDAKTDILTAGAIKTVRHIQRGTLSVGGSEVEATLTGFTDLSKMICLLDGSSGSSSETNGAYMIGVTAYVAELTTTKLKISPGVSPRISYDDDYYRTGTVSYQVIEFY